MKDLLKFLAPFFAMNAYDDFKEGVTGKKAGFFESIAVGLATHYSVEKLDSSEKKDAVEEAVNVPEEVFRVPSRPVAVSKNPAGKHIKDFLK